jgi:hypothetical protein
MPHTNKAIVSALWKSEKKERLKQRPILPVVQKLDPKNLKPASGIVHFAIDVAKKRSRQEGERPPRE